MMGGMSTGETWARRRRLVIAVAPVLPLAAILAMTWRPEDWWIAQRAGGLILSGDLAVYAQVPEAQMGPLALLLAGALPLLPYLVIGCGMLPLVVALATAGYQATPRLAAVAAAGVGGLGLPWAAYSATGHLDDGLVALGAALMVWSLRTGRGWLTAVGFVCGMAGKPTAVLLMPLLFLVPRRMRVAAIGGAVAVWAPFAFADLPGFLAAGGGVSVVWPWSLPDLLGADAWGAFPGWVRPVQFFGGVALVAWLGVRRSAPEAALLAAFAFRALLEPGAWHTYTVAVIVAGVLWDARHATQWPVVTVAAVAVYFVGFSYESLTPLQAGLRLAALVAAVAYAITQSAGRPPRPTSPVPLPAGSLPRPTSP